MNRPEDFDQNQNNENKEYDPYIEGQNTGSCSDPQQQPHWYGISYQNQNGGYAPPMSFYEVENVGKKKKGNALEIVNAFQGEEAEELYNRLITVKNA